MTPVPGVVAEITAPLKAPTYDATSIAYFKMVDAEGALCFPDAYQLGLDVLVRVEGQRPDNNQRDGEWAPSVLLAGRRSGTLLMKVHRNIKGAHVSATSSLYRSLPRQPLARPTNGPTTGGAVSETLQPESLAPESLMPETLAPESLMPETLAPERVG